MTLRLLVGDCRTKLAELADESIHCCVTSPPYWGLRDYGHGEQIGLEKTPDEFIAELVDVFRLVRRVLRDDGTLWLNLGDCYATGAGKVGEHPGGGEQGARWRGDVDRIRDEKRGYRGGREGHEGKHATKKVGSNRAQRGDGNAGVSFGPMTQPNRLPIPGLKKKDLCMIPARVALALQADGWYLRSVIVWDKPNPMPESVTDRPTTSHEYLYLLTKNERYFYDHESIKEPQEDNERTRRLREQAQGLDTVFNIKRDAIPAMPTVARQGNTGSVRTAAARQRLAQLGTRNKRTVWRVASSPFKEAHFATFPSALIEPCILAGTSPLNCEHCGAPFERIVGEAEPTGGEGSGNVERKDRADFGGPAGTHRRQAHAVPWEPTTTPTIGFRPTCEHEDATGSAKAIVLDPFGGAGTTALVADRHGRDSVLIELNPTYAEIIRRRITGDSPLFAEIVEAAE